LEENLLYHVLLEGRQLGPYDRRTIVGMRIKKTLTSADLLLDRRGERLTVADLIGRRRAEPEFQPNRSGSYSVVQAMHLAWLADQAGRGLAVPRFRGEIELRLQTRALRLSGRARRGLRLQEDRLKIPLDELAHARARGSLVDIALRASGGAPRQRLTLELFTPESAAEVVDLLRLPPWPPGDLPGLAPRKEKPAGAHPLAWGAVVGTALVVAAVLVWVLTRRV
jgi:hypothetical protein